MEEVRAVSKYLRTSPQKVRRVIHSVKGKPVQVGLDKLRFMPQKAAGLIEKTVRSAVANAEERNLDVDSLVITNICVDQGPSLKRFRPRARGRASKILKRTSHITVILTEESVS